MQQGCKDKTFSELLLKLVLLRSALPLSYGGPPNRIGLVIGPVKKTISVDFSATNSLYLNVSLLQHGM